MIPPAQTTLWPAGTVRLRPEQDFRSVAARSAAVHGAAGQVAGRGPAGADRADISTLGRELAAARRDARLRQAAQEAGGEAAQESAARPSWRRASFEAAEGAPTWTQAAGRKYRQPHRPALLEEATPQARLASAEAAARTLRGQAALETAELPPQAWLDEPQILDYWV
jgi:hypothetical protein